MKLPTLKQTRIIGLGHKARQGKDLVASLLEEEAPGRVRRFACADALYHYTMVAHGMREKDPILLQDVGLAWRQRDPDTWIEIALWRIQQWDADAVRPQLAVITDVRFPNEAEAVRQLDGRLVKIERWIDGERVLAADRPLDHISETALDDYRWDFVLQNDGTIPSLRHRARALADFYLPSDWGFFRHREDAA